MRNLVVLSSAFLVGALTGWGLVAATYETTEQVLLFADRPCTCCDEWLRHVERAGFAVASRNISGLELRALRESLGVPASAEGCHLALVRDRFVLGHVPPASVVRMLDEGIADVRGLVVPLMPLGSPGMETPDGDADEFTVYAMTADGEAVSYEEWRGTTQLR